MENTIYMEITSSSEFNEEAMSKDIDHISVISNNEMVFHFVDGREIRHDWQKLVRSRPKHTEEYKEHMRRLAAERWTDEERKRMSEMMKTMRKEESHRWRKEQ